LLKPLPTHLAAAACCIPQVLALLCDTAVGAERLGCPLLAFSSSTPPTPCQFCAAQAKEDAITFAISSTFARVLDPLQHVEILTACWPFYIHGIEVLCALAEQQQQQWAHDLSQQQEHNQQQDGPHAAAAGAAGGVPA
jgi:hypothetical protein